MLDLEYTFYFNTNHANLTFTDCDFGGAAFNDENCVTISPVGSIFGSGSATMVMAMAVPMIVVAGLAYAVALRKKKIAVKSEDEV